MHWRSIADLDGIWQTDLITQGAPLRAVAFRLIDDRLGVFSPVRGLGADAHAALAALGRPALLVAPNHFHNLGLAEYADAHPGSVIVTTAVAAPRTRAKCKREVEDDTRLSAALPEHISLLVPPDTRTGELWLSVRSARARAWIVGDAFLNIAKTPLSPIGLVLKALACSPGLRISTSFRWLLRDRTAYRRWLLAKLEEERPTILIPCHGDIIVDESLTERLQRLAEARLG